MAWILSRDGSRPTTKSDSVNACNKQRRQPCLYVLPQQAVPGPPSTANVSGLVEAVSSPPPSSLGSSTTGRVEAAPPVAEVPPAVSLGVSLAPTTSAIATNLREKRLLSTPSSSPWSRRQRPQEKCATTGAGVATAAGGLLGKITTVITTAGILAAASAPIGVGALLTEAQCEGASLRGTYAELMDSPRLDTSTEAAAAGIDQTIVATNETYDRMSLDQLEITILQEGRDVPFRNLWSDHVWKNTAEVTFPGAEVLTSFLEGSPPEFKCMNEHYGLSFSKGEAGETFAEGTLTADKVLNWSLLGDDYLELEGVASFVPTDVTSVPSKTFLVAAREPVLSEDLTPKFHYFLSEPADQVDSSICPEPCSEQVVRYYWSSTAGTVYLLDMADVDANPRPCWLDLFEAVEEGPPAGGVDEEIWDASMGCTMELLEKVEDALSASAASSSGSNSGGSSTVAVAAMLIPAMLVSFAVAAFCLLRYQKAQWLKKMRTTDEAWGGGLDGTGKENAVPPPTGALKLGAAGAAVDGGLDDRGTSGVAGVKSSPPPQRVFTDVSMDEEDGGMAATPDQGARPDGRAMKDHDHSGGEEEGDEDRVYPM